MTLKELYLAHPLSARGPRPCLDSESAPVPDHYSAISNCDESALAVESHATEDGSRR